MKVSALFFCINYLFRTFASQFLTLFFNERFYIISHSRIAKAQH